MATGVSAGELAAAEHPWNLLERECRWLLLFKGPPGPSRTHYWAYRTPDVSNYGKGDTWMPRIRKDLGDVAERVFLPIVRRTNLKPARNHSYWVVDFSHHDEGCEDVFAAARSFPDQIVVCSEEVAWGEADMSLGDVKRFPRRFPSLDEGWESQSRPEKYYFYYRRK